MLLVLEWIRQDTCKQVHLKRLASFDSSSYNVELDVFTVREKPSEKLHRSEGTKTTRVRTFGIRSLGLSKGKKERHIETYQEQYVRLSDRYWLSYKTTLTDLLCQQSLNRKDKSRLLTVAVDTGPEPIKGQPS